MPGWLVVALHRRSWCPTPPSARVETRPGIRVSKPARWQDASTLSIVFASSVYQLPRADFPPSNLSIRQPKKYGRLTFSGGWCRHALSIDRPSYTTCVAAILTSNITGRVVDKVDDAVHKYVTLGTLNGTCRTSLRGIQLLAAARRLKYHSANE